MSKLKVSIILVHYRKLDILSKCISSIYKYSKKSSFEIILVDNGEANIKQKIKKSFPKIRYVKSPGNIGYAAGNNLGVKFCRYNNILILNPDTLFIEDIIDKLVQILRRNDDVAIVAPMLVNRYRKAYLQIGIKKLTPLRAAFVLSFINKLFPNNPVSRNYWGNNIKFDSELSVDIVAGSVLMMKKELFEKAKGFDENFFLYFEEVDLCKRIKELGYQIMMIPKLRIIHYWQATTPRTTEIKKIFENSRYYYFKKHYGLIGAFFVEFMARLSIKKFFSMLGS